MSGADCAVLLGAQPACIGATSRAPTNS